MPIGISDISTTCNTNLDCDCNQTCAVDPFYAAWIAVNGSIGVCQFTCTTLAECPNATTSCSNGVCLTNLCPTTAAPGDSCVGNDATLDGGPGTCVPAGSANAPLNLFCLANGTAVTCGGANYDDPQVSFQSIDDYTSNPSNNLSQYCAAGQACNANDSACEQLCAPSSTTCPAGAVCVTTSPLVEGLQPDFGFCGACTTNDGATLCSTNSECCQGACDSNPNSPTLLNICCFQSRHTCAANTDCCSGSCGSVRPGKCD